MLMHVGVMMVKTVLIFITERDATTCAIDQLDFISHLYKHISSRHILGLITYSSR